MGNGGHIFPARIFVTQIAGSDLMIEHFFTALWGDRFLIAGVLAGALSLAAFVPYVADIFRGTTKPDRACWLIWSVLASISGASNLYEGASTSMLFVGSQVLATLVIFSLSIRFGSGHLLGRTNLVILSVAAVGVICWAFMETAVYALAVSIGVSALGGVSTVWKVYNAPNSETMSAWIVLLIAACLGVFSVGSNDPLLLAYPLYLVALYGSILAAQAMGRVVAQERQFAEAWAARRMRVPPVRRPAQRFANQDVMAA